MRHSLSIKALVLSLMCCFLLATGCETETADDSTDTGNGNGNITPEGGVVTIDHIDGLNASNNTLQTGVPITFHIRMNNTTPDTILGLTLGFQIYSTDNATWGSASGDSTGAVTRAMFDGPFFATQFSVTGSSVDTIGFGEFKLTSGTGIPSGFDEVAYTITVGPIDPGNNGLRLCIDSSYYPPGGAWLWSTSNGSVQPHWDGAQCFSISSAAAPKTSPEEDADGK